MYSPKIDEKLIPIIYQLAKQERKPMTKIVAELLRSALNARDVLHAESSTEKPKQQPGS
jgi:hypothetical protein